MGSANKVWVKEGEEEVEERRNGKSTGEREMKRGEKTGKDGEEREKQERGRKNVNGEGRY